MARDLIDAIYDNGVTAAGSAFTPPSPMIGGRALPIRNDINQREGSNGPLVQGQGNRADETDAPAPGPMSPEKQQFINEMLKGLRSFLRDAAITSSRPAHVDPNYWSTPIDLSNAVVVPAAAQVNPLAWTTVITYRVPSGNWLRLSSYGVNVRDPLYTYNGSLLWRILVNGVPLPSEQGFAQQRGTIAQPRAIYTAIPQDQIVQFQVQRAAAWAGADQTVEMALTGWLWVPRNQYDGARVSNVF